MSFIRCTLQCTHLAAGLALAGLLGACAHQAPPPPAAPTGPRDYVVLLTEPNGHLGRVTVKGDQGEQTLDQAGQGAALNGAGQPFVVPPEQLQRDFGAAMAARPDYPDHFYLYFQSGSAKLTSESQALVPTILEKARLRDNADVSVVGHSDTQGEAGANFTLAYQRANTIANLLRTNGMQPASLTIESHGESNLLVPTPDDTPEPRNRRVEVTIR